MDDSADAEAFQETAKVPQVMEPTPAAANEAHVSVAVQENKAESTKADSNVAGDTEQDQDHKSNAGSDWETEEDASAAASDSSSDSEAESIATLDDMQRLQNDCAKHFTSETFFNAYTQRLKEKARNRRGKNQGSTLVKGLVDYMRTLEERISSLEESQDAGSEANTEPGHVETDIYDAQVKLDIKFFDEAAYTYDNIFYAQAHSREEKGTFMCGHDDQHLIRVLYSKHAEAKPKPQKLGKLADPDPPNPSEINMLLCNISSKAIARFFVKILNCNPTDVIRFGNPFRPIIGNIGLIRDHLRKLEGLYGEAAAEGSSEAQRNTNGGSTPSNSSINQKGSDAADFPFNDGQIDNVQAYDQPAALQHFRLFLDFVDKYLGDKIALYDRLRNGKEQQIAFVNLWMLFDVGDTIYCPSRSSAGEEYARPGLDQSPHVPVTRYTPQAYRVVATDGGMPHRSTIGFPTSGAANDGLDTTTFSATMVSAGDPAIETMKAAANISRKIRSAYGSFVVYCFYVDFDGRRYGKVRDVFVFKPYEREMDIRGLQAYPMAYAPSNDLHTRGQRFLEATKVSHLQYEGLTVGPLREEINSPVVVDIKLAYEGGRDIAEALIKVPIISPGVRDAVVWMPGVFEASHNIFGKRPSCSHRWCISLQCTYDCYNTGQATQGHKMLTDADLVLEEYESEMLRGLEGLAQFTQLMAERNLVELLPGMIPGFALRNRKWVLLDISRLERVEQNNEWDNLVLPPGHREMVQAMVETHTQDLQSNRDSRPGMDLVKGKGRGCIILLHGVPGVGKTSTAECVAAHTKKPLYPITCGDVGYKAEDVERNMESHFKLAHRWGCVLLLDEADVFLARRDQKDVQRNGLVSVFLRILEYYSGILFLTTNRVGDIDEAFRSRLHLTLYYPKLKRKQTKKIFKRNFERINDVNQGRTEHGIPPFIYKDSEPKIMQWAGETYKTLQWNGRQIRNTFQTVLALAEFHAKQRDGDAYSPVVTKKLFKIVANAAILFNEYLAATHGADQDKMAQQTYIRANSFEPSKEHRFTSLADDTSESSSQEDDSSSNDSGSDSDESDSSDDAQESMKKSSNAKKGKQSKRSSRKKRKSSAKEKKSEKKSKDKKKEKKKDESSDSDS
ncbi:hypothetical protein PFICI_10841 [Pestalotiopsis fici W106-1]|uniref:AAA+ ATPase domain-containing protein n=1 Tax=Pestalotiopsis fici (strain W106-1 / CGMCC3.15140) TaxID=1229662 RepID=W3WV00_PESFW|nr:uncharacterized protein PFICI_10841 [Pestalotiopsis fici W106-1]ETS76967.1 hypothetical protein PFICI_10841 [Pestalotiopsis fici W106-1]